MCKDSIESVTKEREKEREAERDREREILSSTYFT